MMKVLRILNRFNLGGPTYNASLLTKYLEPEFNTKLVAGIKLESEHGSEFILSKLDIEPIYIREMHRELSIINDFTKTMIEQKRRRHIDTYTKDDLSILENRKFYQKLNGSIGVSGQIHIFLNLL